MKNTESISYENHNAAYSHDIKNYTKNGQCSRCGGCCSQSIAMTDAEHDTIMQYVKDHDIKPAKRSSDRPYADFLCPFLNEANDTDSASCSVYEVRPAICKAFCCDVTPVNGLDKLRSIIDYDIYNLKQYNMGQEFFPDEFGIHNGDYVVPLPIACIPDELKDHSIFIAYDDPARDPNKAVFVPVDVPDNKRITSLCPKYEFQKLQMPNNTNNN